MESNSELAKLQIAANKARNAKHHRKCVYGITQAEYESLFAAQSGACAICQKVFTADIRACIDHDHATGKVRGILCYGCNMGLGKFGDTLEGVLKVVRYLEHNFS